MYLYAVQIGVMLMLSFHPPSRALTCKGSGAQAPGGQTSSAPRPSAAPAKQLFAVRGEITRMETQTKGLVAITVRSAHEVATVTVIAPENDIVGTAVGRQKGADLVGLLAGEDQRENERITAAELREGDLVSIIYDPTAQNRVLEIYVH